MKTMTDSEKLNAIYNMRDRMVEEIEFLYSIAPDAPSKDYISGQVSVYDALVDFLDDVKDGKEVNNNVRYSGE